jgi:hypothetical protein
VFDVQQLAQALHLPAVLCWSGLAEFDCEGKSISLSGRRPE